MFLSNPRPFFLLATSLALIFQACGSSGSNENKPISLTDDTKSEFPFSTKEPEVYQGDFIVISGISEDRRAIARKGNKWRVDFFKNNEASVSYLETDKLYSVDHKKKSYAVNGESESAAIAPVLNDTIFNFFRGKEHYEFDEIGREKDLVIYSIRDSDASKGSVLLYFDPAIGMIVKQEFKSRNDSGTGFHTDYIYEIRNLKTDVDDGVFAIPDGYRKVARAELWPGKIQL